MNYSIETDYPEYTDKKFAVFMNDEFETGCDTLSEAYVYLAKHMQQCALLEMEREGKPCLTT